MIRQTIVSPKLADEGTQVYLIPMAAWKQCLVRAVRSAVQFMILLAGGGKVAEASTGIGLPPGILPAITTGHAYGDMLLLSLIAGVFVFLWNATEFWFSLDQAYPQARA